MRELICVAVFAAGLLAGCARGADEGKPDDEQGPTAPSSQVASAPAESPEAARTSPPAAIEHALLAAPPGWSTRVQGDWLVFTSPDGVSRLAEGALAAGAAVPARLKEAAEAMGASDLHLADEQAISIGPEQLKAQAADGWCHRGKDEARLAYAAVDTGEGRRVLIVHLSAKDAPEETQRAAMTTIAALRRK